jgi:putative oxidoreductase
MTRYSGTDWGLLLLRLGFAALLIGLHGWTRLLRAYNFVVHGQPWTFVDLVGRLGFPYPSVFAVLSALSESVAVALIAVGLFTRPAAAIVAFNMAVAFYNEAGKGDPFETPALYLLLGLVVAVAGPGGLAIDRARGRSPVRK